MVEQATNFINENWQIMVLCGFGGIALVSLIVLFLKGINKKWRWEK